MPYADEKLSRQEIIILIGLTRLSSTAPKCAAELGFPRILTQYKCFYSVAYLRSRGGGEIGAKHSHALVYHVAAQRKRTEEFV